MFVWTAKTQTCVSMMSSPHPSSVTSCNLWRRLITTTMADYMVVFLLEKILCLLGLLSQNIMLLCHHAEQKRLRHRQLHSDCFLLLFICIQRSSFLCMLPPLPLRFRWISKKNSATYTPGTWSSVFESYWDGSVWTQMFLKRCQGKRRKKRSFWYVWTWP